MGVIKAQLARDLRLAFHGRSEWLNPLIFLVLVQSLFPLALGADSDLLRQLAPGVVWVGALLSTLVSLESLFKDDLEDGSLEQMYLSGQGLYLFSLSKLLSHWLIAGLPLVIVSPLLAGSFGLQGEVLQILFVSLLIATPTLCCISALGAALTLNARQSNVLLSLIILPLYVPILIFGSGAILRTTSGESAMAPIYILAAMLALSISVVPFILAAALKLSLSDS